MLQNEYEMEIYFYQKTNRHPERNDQKERLPWSPL